MRVRIATSTATLVVFDPSCLRHRLHDSVDWWSMPSDELAEVNAGTALFVGLGADGVYEVEILLAERLTEPGGVRAFVRNESGEFFVGPGEDVSADGLEPPDDSGCRVEVPPGAYEIHVRGRGDQLRVTVAAAASMQENAYVDGPSLVESVDEASGQEAGSIEPSELVGVLGLPPGAEEVARLLERLGDTTRKQADDVFRVMAQDLGIEVLFKYGKLAYIHLYDECEGTRTRAAFQRWPFGLPEGLGFGMTREAVLERLGEPRRGGALFGIYRFETHGLRVGFAAGVLVSVNLLWLESEVMQQGCGPRRSGT